MLKPKNAWKPTGLGPNIYHSDSPLLTDQVALKTTQAQVHLSAPCLLELFDESTGCFLGAIVLCQVRMSTHQSMNLAIGFWEVP